MPALFSIGIFRALSWRQAVDTETYQRLRLRIMLMWLALGVVSGAVAIGGAYLYQRGMLFNAANAVSVVATLAGALLFLASLAVAIILTYQQAKLEVARLHAFNITLRQAIVVVLALFVGFVVLGVNQGLHPASNGLVWFNLPVAAFFALYAYYMFFENPAQPSRYPAYAPLKPKQTKLETVLRFIQQVMVWYSILATPMQFLHDVNAF